MLPAISGFEKDGTSRSSDDPSVCQPGGRPLSAAAKGVGNHIKSEITLDELSDLYNQCEEEEEGKDRVMGWMNHPPNFSRISPFFQSFRYKIK